MTINFNYNVSQYVVGDSATFLDTDVNGIKRAKGYVANGYASIVVDHIEQEQEQEPDVWGEEQSLSAPITKTKK